MSDVGSDRWIDRFATAVAGLDAGDTRIAVLHRIVDGPAWVVSVDEAGVAVARAEPDAPADVTFTWQRTDAEAVAAGEVSALVPFQAGRLRIGGDLTRLAEAADLFTRFPTVGAGA
jgi:alkyl sulfatase BDS1-like metallo-beta-lactamase superfamily hydrolase